MSNETFIGGTIRLWIVFKILPILCPVEPCATCQTCQSFRLCDRQLSNREKLKSEIRSPLPKIGVDAAESWNFLDLAYKCPFQMSFKTIFPVWDIFAVCWAWQISSYMLQNEGRRALIRRSSNPFDHHQAILLTGASSQASILQHHITISSSENYGKICKYWMQICVSPTL